MSPSKTGIQLQYYDIKTLKWVNLEHPRTMVKAVLSDGTTLELHEYFRGEATVRVERNMTIHPTGGNSVVIKNTD